MINKELEKTLENMFSKCENRKEIDLLQDELITKIKCIAYSDNRKRFE